MRGCLLFAFNTPDTDYFEMATYTANRINRFLNLPVTVITDKNTDVSRYHYTFDNVIITESDNDNLKKKKMWINKGRYQAYDLSPYDETLLLDTDYLINSGMLLKLFDIYDGFMCHDREHFLLNPASDTSSTLWATVMLFDKSYKNRQLFQCIKMVQDNFKHYADIYRFPDFMFRNDFALTVALKLVNGHLIPPTNYIPWQLLHVGDNVKVERIDDVSYKVSKLNLVGDRPKKEYITMRDTDFHMLDKENFIEMMNDG